MPSRRLPEQPPHRGRKTYSYESPSRCGRPTLKGTPCRRPSVMGEGCHFHATDEERAAHAQETAKKREQKEREGAGVWEKEQDALHASELRREARKRDQRRMNLWAGSGCSVLALAALSGLIPWISSNAQNYNREQACRPHVDQAYNLSDKARAISVPLVNPSDPAVAELQLGTVTTDQELDAIVSNPATASTSDEVANAYADRWAAANRAADEVLNHKECFDQNERARAAHIRNAPKSVSSVTMPVPAHCADGWASQSIGRQGACSYHGGVVPGTFWAVLNF
ncbi:hypothetical protein GCM10009566_10190 [Streptomyces murinus]|uniref:DUF3761 domain-containing protein n=1 Tax=Streptomyces murinus TaxID=33900 RepID=A0A7W3NRC5_STRMR|nr:hypothetical protein [Streptomyces murinus]UWW89880.1 DUF3761 domain-containing protein [Streptomyces murinus]